MGRSLPRAVSDRDFEFGGRRPAPAGANSHLRKPKVKNAKLDSRTARARLGPRREPYWHVLAAGCAVGYRRAAGVGTWIARRRAAGGAYRYASLGAADDAGTAQAVGSTLSFDEAKDAAYSSGEDRLDEVGAMIG